MANYTDSIGFNKGVAAYPAYNTDSLTKIEVTLDFATIVAARVAAGATALAATDTLQVLQVPANSLILAAGIEVTEAEATNTTATFSLGFVGGTTNLFAGTVASNALATTCNELAAPDFIAAADTIDLTLNTAAPTNCTIRVFAIVVDCN